jgi:hypothetical protein
VPKLVNPIFQEYTLECTTPDCKGKRTFEHAVNAGWTLGMIVPEDFTCPDLARCFMCKRHQMKVVKAPEPKKPQGPVGWNKIPSE